MAGKCGVFAETDINGLQKEGTPSDELMASLFDAIVLQNLTVLTRGHTLRPHVLLLGGPNTFIRGMREAWQTQHPEDVGGARRRDSGRARQPESCIKTPENAQYFAALGAIEFGKDEDASVGRYLGVQRCSHYINVGRLEEKASAGGSGLSASVDELEAFKKPVHAEEVHAGARSRRRDGPRVRRRRRRVDVDQGRAALRRRRRLSQGLSALEGQSDSGHDRHVRGACAVRSNRGRDARRAGRRHDRLREGRPAGRAAADAALVETVAHTESAVKFYKDPHVIVDVGGQDIKLIVLNEGRVKDFKLNTQCSAGNGYFLQSTAEMFGIPVKEFADKAFAASAMPMFGYGCAVFMQSDIVNFQRQGWAPEEILAGLAAVLPKNIFLYVASIPNLAKLGSRFVLQGGTQHNLAAVKAEVDFIRSNFRGADVQPEIIVHEHCGESGAIGAAVEARAPVQQRPPHAVHRPRCRAAHHLSHDAKRSDALQLLQEQLPAHVHRRQDGARQAALWRPTLVGLATIRLKPDPTCTAPLKFVSKVPKAEDEQRLIIATCEKGTRRRRRRDARHQGRPRRGEEGEPELRRDRGQRSVEGAQAGARGRSDPVARLDARRARRARRARCSAARRSASACRAC